MKINVRDMTLVALFAALMVVGAYLKIPLPWVSLTFQPFFCAFAGILLGARLGFLSQLVYIAMGLVGLPVFTQGGGLLYVLKPSFGYLIGFAAGAYIIGKISETLGRVNVVNSAAALISGLVVIYAIGVPYTYLILRFYMHKPDVAIVGATLVPLFIKDLVLFLLIAAVSSSIVPRVRRSVITG